MTGILRRKILKHQKSGGVNWIYEGEKLTGLRYLLLLTVAFLFIVQDPSIATSLPVIDLVDSIKPGSVNYDLVEQGTDEEVGENQNII